MKDNIPLEINNRILHFQSEVIKHFAFLADYNYIPDKIEIGRTENFFEYYSKFCFKNGDTSINIDFETDIINGHTIKFPQVKQKPVIDSLVSYSISDKIAFMSIECYIEEKHPEILKDGFNISINSQNIKEEITRVVENYSTFFQNNLVSVLKKEKIFDCYTDRFYDKVFKEIPYNQI